MLTAMPKVPKPRHVYVVAWSPRGPAKLDVTDTVTARLADLQKGCPYPLRVYDAIVVNHHDADTVARQVLAELARFRLCGEWLKLTPSLVGKHLWAAAQPFKPGRWQPSANIPVAVPYRRPNTYKYRRAKNAVAEAKSLGLKIIR